MCVLSPFLSIFKRFLCNYAKKKRIFMNKNAFLVGRGGFEPKRETRNPFIFKAFSDYNPPTTQENRADFIPLKPAFFLAKKVIRLLEVDNLFVF